MKYLGALFIILMLILRLRRSLECGSLKVQRHLFHKSIRNTRIKLFL